MPASPLTGAPTASEVPTSLTAAQAPKPHPFRAQRGLFALFLLYTAGSFFFIQYDRFRTWGGIQDTYRRVLAGDDFAPNQYRIGLPLLTHLLAGTIHLRHNQSLPLIETAAYAAALVLLYLVLERSFTFLSAGVAGRAALLGLFFAAAQFPTLWIFPWDRPETLPTAFCLAALFFLSAGVLRLPLPSLCLLAVLISLAQALMRAEVPFVMGVALLLVTLAGVQLPIGRIAGLALGLCSALTGAATQLYLQRIAYPHAVYPSDTPKIELFHNLNPFYPPLHLPVFFVSLLPLLASLVLARRLRLQLEPIDKLALLACLLYLPLWFTTGLVQEVRIYVPFLLLAAPTIAKVWAAALIPGDGPQSPHL